MHSQTIFRDALRIRLSIELSLSDKYRLKALPIEGTVLVDFVNQGNRPDEEDTRFAAGVGRDLDGLDVVEHFALLRHLPTNHLDGDLGVDNEAVL